MSRDQANQADQPYEAPPHGFRTFAIIWASQSISLLGSALTFFAITVWLTQSAYPRPDQKPDLAFALAAISLVSAIPVVFVAPVAGAWADRHDRKHTMMAMDFAKGLLSVALTVLLIVHALNIWILLPLLLLLALFTAFHNAAFDTSYAMLVPEKHLPRANGMMQTIFSLSGIVSPGVAATIISLPVLARQGLIPTGIGTTLRGLKDGTPLATAVDAASFFFAVAAIAPLFVPSPVRSDRDASGKLQRSIWADVGEGATYIWRRRPMLWLLGTFAVANFTGSPAQVLEPLLLKFNLAADWHAHHYTFSTALALLASVGSVGGVLGGLLISGWGGLKRGRVYGVLVPMILDGAATMVFGLSSLIYLTAAMAFVSTAMIPILNAHSQSIWQTQTPRELQGRVFSVRRVIAQCTYPLSTALAGWAGAVFNAGAVIATVGAVLVVFCVVQLFNPYLRRVEDKDYIEAIAARAVAR